MQDYRVELDVFHGPLDLLMYLIKRDEIDIHDIPIGHITEQYIQYVHQLKSLDINIAGEFLVMAATLMEIKSIMMLPIEEGQNLEDIAPGDDPSDPRFELVQQLLAYKRFKDAATELDERRAQFASRFPRFPAKIKDEKPADQTPDIDMEDVSVWDLLEAFSTLMEQVGDSRSAHEVIVDDTPIELHAADIVDRLQRDGAMTLQNMFVGRNTRGEMLGLFLAMLELLRQRKVKATQPQVTSDIHVQLRPENEWQDPDAMEPDHDDRDLDPTRPENFDWPNDEFLKRYTRRIERRKKGESIEEDAQLEEDIRELQSQEDSTLKPPSPPLAKDPTRKQPIEPQENANPEVNIQNNDTPTQSIS